MYIACLCTVCWCVIPGNRNAGERVWISSVAVRGQLRVWASNQKPVTFHQFQVK